MWVEGPGRSDEKLEGSHHNRSAPLHLYKLHTRHHYTEPTYTQSYNIYMKQQEICMHDEWIVYHGCVCLPLVVKCSLSSSVYLLWLTTGVKLPSNFYALSGSSCSMAKTFYEDSFIDISDHKNDKNVMLTHCLIIWAKHLLDVDHLSGFMADCRLSCGGRRGGRQGDWSVDWGGHRLNTCGRTKVKYFHSIKAMSVKICLICQYHFQMLAVELELHSSLCKASLYPLKKT